MRAQFNCGIMLKNGDGVPVNLPLAYYYLCLASSNKDLDDMQLDAKNRLLKSFCNQFGQSGFANLAGTQNCYSRTPAE